MVISFSNPSLLMGSEKHCSDQFKWESPFLVIKISRKRAWLCACFCINTRALVLMRPDFQLAWKQALLYLDRRSSFLQWHEECLGWASLWPVSCVPIPAYMLLLMQIAWLSVWCHSNAQSMLVLYQPSYVLLFVFLDPNPLEYSSNSHFYSLCFGTVNMEVNDCRLGSVRFGYIIQW